MIFRACNYGIHKDPFGVVIWWFRLRSLRYELRLELLKGGKKR